MPGFSLEDEPLDMAHRVLTKEAALAQLPNEVTVYDPDSRSGAIGGASIVEGLLAESLSSIKHSVDYLYGELADHANNSDVVVGTFRVIAIDLMGMVDMLVGYHDAALKPKHRAVRAIFVGMIERMKDNDLQEDASPERQARFAKDVVSFLESAHICMLEGTNRKKRHYYKRKFLDGA